MNQNRASLCCTRVTLRIRSYVPRKAHPRRESKEERPERPQCGFHISAPQRTPRGIITNMHTITKEAPTRCGASFHISDSGRTPSGSPQKMHNPQVNQQSKITPYRRENARTALPTPAEQKRSLPQSVLLGTVRRAAGVSQLKRSSRTANAPSSLPTRAGQKRNLPQSVLLGAVRRAAGVSQLKRPTEPPTPRHRSRPARNRNATSRNPSCLALCGARQA